MCGIAGYISREQNLINEMQIEDTLNLMKRRGPIILMQKINSQIVKSIYFIVD